MDGNEELLWLSWDTHYGRIETQGLLVGERERGKEFNKSLRFLRNVSKPRITDKCPPPKKKTHTAIKLNASLMITEERQQNQALVVEFSMVMPNVARRHGSSRMTCCMLH